MAIIERHKLNPNEFDIPGRIAGKRADRIIVDDPHATPGATALHEFVVREMMARMYSAGYFTETFGRRETATQKAEREREERMSKHLAEERLRREVEELAERRRRATDEAVMRAFRGGVR